MGTIFGLVISSAAIFTGLWMTARPDSVLRQDPEYLENVSPDAARRRVGVSGAVLSLMGLIGWYAILFENGPVDPVGF
jgi:hypothetical protein